MQAEIRTELMAQLENNAERLECQDQKTFLKKVGIWLFCVISKNAVTVVTAYISGRIKPTSPKVFAASLIEAVAQCELAGNFHPVLFASGLAENSR